MRRGAMKIDVNYGAGVNASAIGSAANLAGFKSQIDAVASLYANNFVDPVTVNINVNYGATSGNAIGESLTPLIKYSSYDPIKKALTDDETSIDDHKAVKNLPATDSHSFFVTR